MGHFSRLTRPWNALGLPALSVPCGFADGRPLGLQMIGRPFDEATLFRTGHAYEQAAGWWRRARRSSSQTAARGAQHGGDRGLRSGEALAVSSAGDAGPAQPHVQRSRSRGAASGNAAPAACRRERSARAGRSRRGEPAFARGGAEACHPRLGPAADAVEQPRDDNRPIEMEMEFPPWARRAAQTPGSDVGAGV